jgi:hypothetical protein
MHESCCKLVAQVIKVIFIVPLDSFLLCDIVVVPNSHLLLLVGKSRFKDMPLPENRRAESQLKCQLNNLPNINAYHL